MATRAPSHPWRRWLGATIAILAVLMIWVLGVGIDVDLGWLRDDIDATLTAALGADAHIAGAIVLETRLPPGVSVGDVRVTTVVPIRVGGVALDAVAVDRLKIRIALPSLLRGVVALRELEADGVLVHLIPAPDTAPGTGPGESPPPPPDSIPEAEAIAAARASAAEVLSAVEHVRFRDVAFEIGGRPVIDSTILRIETLGGPLDWESPVSWAGASTFAVDRVEMHLRSDSLAALLQRGEDWQIGIDLAAEGRRGRLSTTLARRERGSAGAGVLGAVAGGLKELDVLAELEADRLSRFSTLLGLDLAETGPLRITSALRLVPDRVSYWEFQGQLAGSSASGELTVEQLDPLVLLAQLHSPAIELLDFGIDAGDVTAILAPRHAEATAAPDARDAPGVGAVMSLAPAPVWTLLGDAQARLTLEAEEVRWNGERLGAGTLVASASEGLLLLAPLRIELPGGEIEFNAELAMQGLAADVRVRGEIDGLDWGVLLRQLDPDTDMGGRLWLALDVASRLERWTDLLPHGAGTLRVAVEPENLQSGILDLWAVDLIGALAGRYDPESVVQCAAARIRLEDGVARDEAIVLETTKVRVVGRGQVDFRAGTADLAFRPKPKSRQLLSLDPAVRVHGSLDEIETRLRAGDLLESIAGNAARVFFFPLPFLLEAPAPADGRVACREVFDAVDP